MSAQPALDQPVQDLPTSSGGDAPSAVEAPKGAVGVAKAKDDFVKQIAKQLKSGKYKSVKNLDNKKLATLLRRALKSYKNMDYRNSALLALKATKVNSESLQAHQILALSLEGMGELSKAIDIYQRAILLDPTDCDTLLNVGLLAWNMKLYEVAEKFFRIFLTLKPGAPAAVVNLAGTLRDVGRADDAVDLLKMALYKNPELYELWNSLGAVVMEQGKYEESVTFYEESLRLNPEYARSYHNLAYTVHHLGRAQDALDYYAKAMKLMGQSPDRIESQHGRALALLDLGQLEEGFEAWEVRNLPSFRESMIIAVKAERWSDQDIGGKKILAMGEQGLGDEVAFANALPELIERVGPDGKVFIAVDKRLVELYQRSYPDAVVGTYSGFAHNGKVARVVPWLEDHGGVDLYTTFGTILARYRKTIEDFPTDRMILTPDPDKVAHWKDELKTLGDGPYVGVCWRSMKVDGVRRKYYSPIEQWGPILRNTDVTFVNLQYGDFSDDIKEAQTRFGITIHELDLDLKDDLDTNAALCQALDLTIAAPTAAAAFSAGVGTETWFVTIGRVWPMLGTDHFPWYPKTRVIYPETYADWRETMAKTGDALGAFVAAHQS